MKILLISHAHFDHDGGSAEVKKLTGGGANTWSWMEMWASSNRAARATSSMATMSAFLYPAVKVDRVLHDGNEVKLGDTVLTAHKTAGHTRGCTTWSLKVNGRGKDVRCRHRGQPERQSGIQAGEQYALS